MALEVKPETAHEIETLALAEGLSVDAYLRMLIGMDDSVQPSNPSMIEESGMVLENGLLVYRTGRPLPDHVVDDAIRRSREERSRRILGNRP